MQPSLVRALSMEKGPVFDVNVQYRLQLPEARVKNAARLEREDLRMGIDIWKCKYISQICSIFQTMRVQF